MTEHSCVTGIVNNEQILSFIIQHYALKGCVVFICCMIIDK